MNDNEQGSNDARTEIEDKAIEWFVRMRGEDAEALRSEFEAWIAASPVHEEAYQWAERHFGASGILKGSRQVGHGFASPLRKWSLVGAAAAAGIAITLSVHGAWAPKGGGGKEQTAQNSAPLATRHGEIRTFRLADGSDVTLDSDSRVEVSMTEVERHVKLSDGKARFAVARDPRPFVVEAGSGAIRTDSATVDVGYDDQRQIEVTLVSGSAQMTGSLRPAVLVVPVQSLVVGRPIRYPAADYQPEPAPDTGTDRKDWPSGWVEYRAIPLANLITEANRYASQPIILDDPEIGELVASGRFKLTDTETFLSRIAEVFDLSVSRRADGIHLSRK